MITRQQSRQADQFAIERLKIPAIVLMENAGRGCAEFLMALEAGEGVVVCCGGGNNGGDGFVIARHLHNSGVRVKVILFASPAQYIGDARTNLRIIERLKIRIVQFDSNRSDDAIAEQLTRLGRFSAAWIVDAILGTGASGPLRTPLARLVELINSLKLKKMAVDIPTGMDCDTGNVDPIAFRADVTCTFIEEKVGFGNPAAWPYLGHVKVVGIGAPLTIVRDVAI